MKIMFTGGGTLGSVTPLLAVAEEFPRDEKLWLGTRTGPERVIIEGAGITFRPIPAGKLRRYLSVQTFFEPFRIAAGFFAALVQIRQFRPHVIVTAGGFVGVPVAWAARLCRVPVVVFHLDAELTLATRATAWCASKVVSATGVVGEKIGVPVRSAIEAARARRPNRSDGQPTILVLGGGTGAQSLNEAIVKIGSELVKNAHILHVTGGRIDPTGSFAALRMTERYRQVEFLHEKELADAYASADIVISRAGMGAIGDLANVGIATILVPYPNSPQEANAEFVRRQGAALVATEGDVILNAVEDLIEDPTKRSDLGDRFHKLLPTNARARLVALIRSYASSPVPQPHRHTPS